MYANSVKKMCMKFIIYERKGNFNVRNSCIYKVDIDIPFDRRLTN